MRFSKASQLTRDLRSKLLILMGYICLAKLRISSSLRLLSVEIPYIYPDSRQRLVELIAFFIDLRRWSACRLFLGGRTRVRSLHRRRTADMDSNRVAMTSNVEPCNKPGEYQCRCHPASANEIACRSERDESSSNATAVEAWNWRDIPLYKQLLLGLLFVGAFLILDGSSTASQGWEGAPPWYLPVGLTLTLLLCGGWRYVPVVFISSVVAAVVNYHRPILSWCGIPGSIAIYLGYVGAAAILKRRWRIDLKLGTLRDVGRYVVISLGAAILSALFGVLTLLGDGRISRSDALRTTVEWWVSDALAIVAFAPFVLVHVAPLVGRWLSSGSEVRLSGARRGHASATEILELTAQAGFVVFGIWFVFGYAPAIPYQPLYLLFIPVIWVAVRRGLPGAVLTTFAISVGMTFAAWITQAQRGSLPRLQLAMLALGLTGLYLGAVVSERKRVERAIRKSEKRYRLLFERNLAGVFRTTLAGRVVECNQAAASMFGYDLPEEVMALPVANLYDTASDREAFLTKLKSEKSLTNREMRFRRKNGDSAWAMLNASLVDDDSGIANIVEGTLVDITERKFAEERVQTLAYYDALTGLPNRILLGDRLSKALATARRQKHKVALLFLDLDRFKIINDSLGHSVGDLLLQDVAERLKSFAREQDTVARLGGDEFLIVLTNIKDIPGAAVAAERFMDAMTTSFVVQGHSLSIGCSLGISIFPEHGADNETLIKNADAAMYSAKDSGRNNFRFFTADMNAQAVERLTLENGLRLALDKKELFLEYQPQMDTVNGKITGLEALLRWRHPDLGLVPPDQFIGIAENSGLIVPIGEWVLRTACSQARKWQEEGLPAFSIAINVSAVQFRQQGFCELIRRVLCETGLAPHYLELELTESLLLANVDVTLSVLQELKAMGLTLAIDDFGTGYSSFSYLKRFPISKLKIDRSFVRDVAVNPDDAAITTAIISMAKSLNLKVIAEGVEEEAQMSFLRSHQCDEIQGYYFSKPLTIGEIADKLRGGHSEEHVAAQASGDNCERTHAAVPN
jgi:diguanylate cyclase (GGDEF)-like protein/PAS domain S-box-containing protein